MNLQELLAQAKQADERDKSKDKLFLSILGPSGSGKSHSIGTLGVKTLYLYFTGEKHGVESARKTGSEYIDPVCLDYDAATNTELKPDDVLKRLREIIGSDLAGAGYEAIAIDGMSELDDCINQTKELQKACLTSQGKIDGFRKPGEVKRMASNIIKQLVKLQQVQGLHVIATTIVDVKDYGDNGLIAECHPRLNTYALAEGLLQQFGDRVIVSLMTKESGERVYVFDFMTNMSKTSKDATGRVKKTFNFSPRLSTGTIPEQGVMKADLQKLLEYKNA